MRRQIRLGRRMRRQGGRGRGRGRRFFRCGREPSLFLLSAISKKIHSGLQPVGVALCFRIRPQLASVALA